MIAREVNVFLTRAALLDPRMKRTDPREQADMASAWADVLDDVDLEAALAALKEHYRSESNPITPARVIELAGVEAEPYPIPSIDEQLALEARTRALEAAGVTEAEYTAHEHDIEWLRAKFAPLELEADRG